MTCSSGNMSQRINDTYMLATATRSWMDRLSAEDVAVCCIQDGTAVNGRKPTVEIAFHAQIMRARPDVNVVLHLQTPFATTLACGQKADVNYFVIPEIPYYIGSVGRVPYLPPGSPELAAAVSEAMNEHDMVVLANHGLVTVGEDFDRVIENAEFFELASRIIVQAGGAAKPLSNEAVRQLLAARHQARGTG